MDRLGRRWGWTVALLVILASTTVGFIAYGFGVSHGIAQSGANPELYGWHRPGGFGVVFPLLFIFMWVALAHGPWWGWGPPWRHRYYYPGEYGPHPVFEEWHRRAHERMKEQPPADDPGRRG
jgi:hypothetical protein